MCSLSKTIFTIAVVFAFCSSLLAGDIPKFGKITDGEFATGPPSEFPDANAIVLFDRGTLEITLDAIRFHRHVRIKVFNKAGAKEAGDIEIGYYDKDKIKQLKAHTVTPNGKKHKVGKKQIHTKSSGSYRTKVLSFPNIEDGSIIEYTYINTNRRFYFLQPWHFQTSWFTKESVFELKLDPGFTYSSVTLNVPSMDQKPVKATERSTKVNSFTWSRKDVPPLEEEPFMATLSNFRSSLYYQLVSYKSAYQNVTFIEGWPDLGTEFCEYIDAYVQKTDFLQPLADSLVTNAATDEDKVRAIYDYVVNNIATKRDDGGSYFTHEKLEQLLTNKFGTTEEKNVLIVKLCEKAGLTAWPMLICTRDHGRFNPRLYQLRQFNYVIAIAQVGSDTLSIDASTRFCPFGTITPNCMTGAGFILDGEDSRIAVVPQFNPRTYRMDVTTIDLTEEGTAICSTATRLSGHFSSIYGKRYEQWEPDEFLTRYFLDRLDVESTAGEQTFDYETERNHCVVSFDFSTDELVEEIDNNLVISPICFRFTSNPFESNRRTHPIDFDYPFVHHNIVHITIPEGKTLVSSSEPINVEIPGAKFLHRIVMSEGKAIVESKLTLQQDQFPSQRYAELKELFDIIAEANTEQVVLATE